MIGITVTLTYVKRCKTGLASVRVCQCPKLKLHATCMRMRMISEGNSPCKHSVIVSLRSQESAGCSINLDPSMHHGQPLGLATLQMKSMHMYLCQICPTCTITYHHLPRAVHAVTPTGQCRCSTSLQVEGWIASSHTLAHITSDGPVLGTCLCGLN